uniref:Uncharacterized protein n=1 Tax=Myoviridae sp. ctsQA11 TaxID=2825193 RepID=A0A8S5U791_9CAUD|nr:MAG TPA: hypothetical protein [Myoviridae sp. ctsQA11]
MGTNFSAMYGNIVYIYNYVPYVADFFCLEVRTWE